MIAEERLAALLDNGLDSEATIVLERELARDEQALRFILEQRRIDCALRSILGPAAAKERIKASILAAVEGWRVEQPQVDVLEDTSRVKVLGSTRSAVRAVKQDVRSNPNGKGSWSKEDRIAVDLLVKWLQALVRPKFASAAAIIVLGIAVLLLVSSRKQPAERIEIGQFAVVIGNPLIEHPGAEGKSDAKNGTPVHLGDRIETGDADRAEVQFHDGTTLRLYYNTTVELLGLQPGDPQNTPGGSASLALRRPPEVNLRAGQIWTKVQKVTNAAAQYSVRTPVATAIARGTEFGLKVGKAEPAATNAQSPALQAVLTVREGTVDFTNRFGSIRATAMTESTARASSAPTEPRPLQTLQISRGSASYPWVVTGSPLTWAEATGRLSLGGYSAGLKLRDLPVPGGNGPAQVIQVAPGSSAERGGIQRGDVVLAINGVAVKNSSEVAGAIVLNAGADLVLMIQRGAEVRRINVTAEIQPSILPGPELPADIAARLAGITRQLDAGESMEDVGREADAALRAAAENNWGVLLELKDQTGPAIRAYGRAAHRAPEVALYHYNLGLALRKIGSFERASEELESAARLAPDPVAAIQHLAEIKSLLGDDMEAQLIADQAVAKQPYHHGAWEIKAQILLKQNRLDEAIAASRKAMELALDCAVAHGLLAQILQAQGKHSEAKEEYLKALALDPSHPRLHYNFGTLYSAGQDFAAAEASYRRAIELQADFALGYQALGTVLSRQRKFSEAVAALEKARELDPYDVSAPRELGDVLRQQRKWEAAQMAYQAALELLPNDMESLCGLAEVLRLKGLLPEAENHYRRALELNPRHVPAHVGLGLVEYDLGDLGKAEERFRKAIEIDSNGVTAHHNLGEMYRTRGDLVQAERLFVRARELDSTSAESLASLGLIAKARGKLPEAEKLLREALALDSLSSEAHNNLGEVLRAAGRDAEAEHLYRKSIELNPDIDAPANNLAILHATRKEYAEAEKMFRAILRRAKKLDASQLPTLVNLAFVCGSQGKLVEAEVFFRQAMTIAPDEPRLWNSFASFLAEHGLKLDEALSLARRALKTRPLDSEYLATLGRVQLRRGNLDDAESALKQALGLPGGESMTAEIRPLLEEIQQRKSTGRKE